MTPSRPPWISSFVNVLPLIAASISGSMSVSTLRGATPGLQRGYNLRAMRLLLQQRPDGREAPRFVRLQLQPDLLGGWELLRETGQIGGRSTLRREQYSDQASAQQALEAARDAQIKRGFQLMFAQGEAAR